MKRLFGLLLFLAVLTLIPWPTLNPEQVSDLERWSPLVIGGGCILGIIAVYVDITVGGLRNLKRQPH